MANGGLVVSGIIITAFALVLLNPVYEFPDLGLLNAPVPINADAPEWTVVAVIIFVIVFLTGASMMAKGFLERKVVKSVAVRDVHTEAEAA
jgi:hypothetical protein